MTMKEMQEQFLANNEVTQCETARLNMSHKTGKCADHYHHQNNDGFSGNVLPKLGARRYAETVEETKKCEECGEEFHPRKLGRKAQRYCFAHSSKFHSMQRRKIKILTDEYGSIENHTEYMNLKKMAKDSSIESKLSSLIRMNEIRSAEWIEILIDKTKKEIEQMTKNRARLKELFGNSNHIKDLEW